MNSKVKTANWTIAFLLLLVNGYFLPLTVEILWTTGGPFGLGLIFLPVSFSINLLLISAGFVFMQKFNKSFKFLIVNTLGLFWALFWFWMLLIDSNGAN
jgi:hypothetical protein